MPPLLASLEADDLDAVVRHPLQAWAVETIAKLLHELRSCERPADYADFQRLLFQIVFVVVATAVLIVVCALTSERLQSSARDAQERAADAYNGVEHGPGVGRNRERDRHQSAERNTELSGDLARVAQPGIVAGVRAQEAAQLLERFFAGRR